MIRRFDRLTIVIALGVTLLVATACGRAASAAPPLRLLSEAPWGGNVRVTDDTGAHQFVPAIAVDPSGNAYAVWEDQRVPGESDIYFSYRPAGGSWGSNVRVDDDAGTASVGNPSIVVDPSGNAYAVWTDGRTGGGDIYFAYRPAGGSWGTNVGVNDDEGTAYQAAPSIAVDASGNAYALWKDGRNDFGDIYFAYRPAGGSWATNVKVNDDPGTAWQADPSIAVDPSGNAYAVWQDYRNGVSNPDIYFSYRPAGGSWGTNARVDDDATGAYQYTPRIAVDATGNAYAVWYDYRNGFSNPDIYFSYRSAGGSWSADVKVNYDPWTTDQFRPSIAVDPSGNAYALWEDCRDDFGDIYFSYRPAGGSWSANVKVNDDPGTAWQSHPSIAVDPSGNAYSVWADGRNGYADIYFSSNWWASKVYLPLILRNHQ
jgi:hypothetical protein